MSLNRMMLALTLWAALVLAACGVSTPVVFTPTAESKPAATVTSVPTVAPTATTVVTPTPAPSVTATGAAAAKVITAENAGSLAPLPLTLSEPPQRLMWVSPGAALPDGLTPQPDLIAFAGSMLYPVTMNPPAVGQPVAMPVPGQVMDFTPGLNSVAAAPDPNAGPLILYDLTGKQLITLSSSGAYGASFSPDGSLIAVASPNELAVTVYDTASGQPVNRLTGFQTAAPVYGAGIVPGNQTIYWISRATLEFQDVATAQMGQKLNFQDFIGAHEFSPDGTRLALSVSGQLLLYSVPDAKKLAEVTLSEPVTSIDFSPDGKLIASSYGTGIQIWDAATLSPVTRLPGPNSFTGIVTFSPDGRYLVSQHESSVIEVWWVK